MNEQLALGWLIHAGLEPVPKHLYSQVKNYDIENKIQIKGKNTEVKVGKEKIIPTDGEKKILVDAIKGYMADGFSSDETIYSRLMFEGKLPTRGTKYMEFVSIQRYTRTARKETKKPSNKSLIDKYLMVIEMYKENGNSREEISSELGLTVEQVNYALKKCGVRINNRG